MHYTSIREIAAAVNKSVDNLLADIKGVFGDDFPEVHGWTADTRLPDDTVTYKILELYNLKAEVSQHLPKGELTTLPEMMLATSQSQNYAVTQLVQDLKTSVGDFLGVAFTEGVVTAYNNGKTQALETLSNLIESDLREFDVSIQQSLDNLTASTKNSYRKSEELRGKLAVASYQRSLNSQELQSNLSNLIASLKRS